MNSVCGAKDETIGFSTTDSLKQTSGECQMLRVWIAGPNSGPNIYRFASVPAYLTGANCRKLSALFCALWPRGQGQPYRHSTGPSVPKLSVSPVDRVVI